jgi:uncharacterized protein (TIGR01777 family)
MSEPQSVLVTGATGLVGRRLVPALHAAGFTVRAVTRNPARAGLPPGVETVEWNGRTITQEMLFRTHAVVHLSGEPVFGGRLTDGRKRRILDSRVASTKAIVGSINALPEADRPACFVCASAVGYYGDRGDEPLPESAAAGSGFLAEVCEAWEDAAAACEAFGVRRVSLRIGVVLAREGGALATMRLPFSLGLGGRFGAGKQWFPWIHVDDLVSLLVATLSDDRYRGAVNAVAPNPVTNAELTAELGRRLRRPTLLTVPAFAAKLALGELSGELFGSRRAVPEAASKLGFEFRYPELADALAAEL